MSVATMARGGMAFSSSRSICRGCMYCESFATSSEYGSCSWVHPASSRSHAAFSPSIVALRLARFAAPASSRPRSRSTSAAAAARASPWMPTLTGRTRPSIRASASTWMICAFAGQYSMPYCGRVPNGPRRVPSASTTSACAISFIAALEPW